MTPSQEDSRPNPQGSSTPGGGNSIADATTHGLGEELAGIGNSVLGTEAVPTTKVGPVDGSAGGSPGSDGNGQQGGRGGRDGGRSGRDGGRPGGRRGGRRGRAEELMVPEAEFTSYYGHRIVKPAPWSEDIPIYLFLGGVAAGSSLLAAGADLTGRPTLRRSARIAALGAITISLGALVHDLGKPSRFYNMLRVFKPTSPMSVGTWILTAYGPGAALAAVSELVQLLPGALGPVGRLLDLAARPAGIASALIAPGVASYTAVLLTDTATPAWHSAHRELPFVFVGSAAAASGGFGMLTAPVSEAAPARRLAVAGAVVELAVEQVMERSMGLPAETLHHGTAGRLIRASQILTATGAVGAAVLGGRSRLAAAGFGLALLAGSACTRFGVFEAGLASVEDPKYTVVPQRERLARRVAEQGQQASSETQPSAT